MTWIEIQKRDKRGKLNGGVNRFFKSHSILNLQTSVNPEIFRARKIREIFAGVTTATAVHYVSNRERFLILKLFPPANPQPSVCSEQSGEVGSHIKIVQSKIFEKKNNNLIKIAQQ